MAEEEKNALPDKKSKPQSAKLEIYDWIECVVTAIVAGILIFMFVGRVVRVDGSSMYPTLHDNDRIITSNLFYTPENGDIIVLRTEAFGEELLVKRIIATGGQTVDIDFNAGVVYVDGVALKEDYVNSPTFDRENFQGEITVPEGYLFVMGDNRNASTDSRSSLVGFVSERDIIGKVLLVLIPRGNDTRYDFSRFGSPY